MTRLPKRPRVRPATIAAALVLLLIAFTLLMIIGAWNSTGTSDAPTRATISRSQLAQLRVGSSKRLVERQLGKGLKALAYEATGVAVEPMSATCTYYAQAGTGNLRDIVQLCFRDDQLVAKRAYAATPGAQLVG
jgi:hypothetical protein